MKDTASRVLRVGLPSGSLQEPTFALFAKAGFNIRLLRAQEISRFSS